MKHKNLYIAIIILTILGIINATYLSYQAYNILNPSESQIFQSICDWSDSMSCTNFLNLPESRIFGIPFPYIALVVYPVLFILSLIAFFGKNKWAMKTIAILATLGFCFNSYIISQEIIVRTFCPLCMMCTGYIIAIAIMAWKITLDNDKK